MGVTPPVQCECGAAVAQKVRVQRLKQRKRFEPRRVVTLPRLRRRGITIRSNCVRANRQRAEETEPPERTHRLLLHARHAQREPTSRRQEVRTQRATSERDRIAGRGRISAGALGFRPHLTVIEGDAVIASALPRHRGDLRGDLGSFGFAGLALPRQRFASESRVRRTGSHSRFRRSGLRSPRGGRRCRSSGGCRSGRLGGCRSWRRRCGGRSCRRGRGSGGRSCGRRSGGGSRGRCARPGRLRLPQRMLRVVALQSALVVSNARARTRAVRLGLHDSRRTGETPHRKRDTETASPDVSRLLARCRFHKVRFPLEVESFSQLPEAPPDPAATDVHSG
jgi:hypothetical protein